jgi:hypothetical protein
VKKIFVIGSIVLNIGLTIALAISWLLFALSGCPETNGELMVLQKDVSARCPGKGSELFTLPKGLVVQDVSASGAGFFETNRFKIVITTDDETYTETLTDSLGDKCGHGYFYSADHNSEF